MNHISAQSNHIRTWSSESFAHIFRSASTTYYYSSLIFPHNIKEAVFRLYAFVRRADDYVDSVPQQKDEFIAFCESYHAIREGSQPLLLPTNHPEDEDIIRSFVELEKEYNFDYQWTESFLHSMELDTQNTQYLTMEDTLEYIYGSASVIGLYMCQIMNISPRAWESAKMLGNAFQYINFIRDIAEDNTLGRVYFPQSELNRYALTSLDKTYIMNGKTVEFTNFIRAQIEQYTVWQQEAEKGFTHLPSRVRIAIQTASELYKWTGASIEKNPLIVFDTKIKPNKRRVLRTFLQSLLSRQNS